MRRRILTILLAALVVAIAVPLGATLSYDRHAPIHARMSTAALATSNTPSASQFPEAGALALAGGLLIGLAAAVRRA